MLVQCAGIPYKPKLEAIASPIRSTTKPTYYVPKEHPSMASSGSPCLGVRARPQSWHPLAPTWMLFGDLGRGLGNGRYMGLVMDCYGGFYGILAGLNKSTDHPSIWYYLPGSPATSIVGYCFWRLPYIFPISTRTQESTLWVTGLLEQCPCK